MLHLLQYCQNDFTFSPSLYSVALCDNIRLVLLILRLVMLFCHSSYCTMCIIHPDLVSFTFYTIPISPLCNLKNFSFTCIHSTTVLCDILLGLVNIRSKGLMKQLYFPGLFNFAVAMHVLQPAPVLIHVHLHSWLGLMTSEPKELTKRSYQAENLFLCNKFISSSINMY